MDSLRLAVNVPLRDFALDVELAVGREVVALVGPSGAGKTTLLRAVAGLVAARGTIQAGGEEWLGAWVDVPPEQRRVGLVFQDYALFPHLSVRANVEFGRGARRDGLLERFGLARLANAKPGELSGGERQRVAVARALATDPSVLLLDEPLSALDAQTKSSVRLELHQLLREANRPTLVVTHDFEDAATLATRVGVLVRGRLLQTGTPAELVARPANGFVAQLTGANVLPGTARAVDNGLTEVVLGSGQRIRSAERAEGDVAVVVYPWDVTVARAAGEDSAQNHIAGAVRSIAPLGNRVRIQIGPLTAEVTAESAQRLRLAPGDQAVATFKATGTKLLAR
jgi:molybdate transport system ATP-binding protein